MNNENKPRLQPLGPEHADYLRDESRRSGRADFIVFPESEQDVRDALMEAKARKLPVTMQGSRTGITAGAVPGGGLILNLSRMNRITGLKQDPDLGLFSLSVQPGLLLSDLRQALQSLEFNTEGWSDESLAALKALKESIPFFFPPDPTEVTASVGGMISCNASGACTFMYGPTRNFIAAIRVVLADGSVLDLQRGLHQSSGRQFSVTTDAGRVIAGTLPDYTVPPVKNAAGYFIEEDMDLIDLFIGSEGTLGVVTGAELKLIPEPAFCWGITAFLPSEESAVQFVRHCREVRFRPAALEYFDHHALDLLRKKRKEYSFLGELPELPPEHHTAVYVEYHGDEEEPILGAVATLSRLITEHGGEEESAWIATDDREMTRMKAFRHAVPETVNKVIDERRQEDPALIKLGTDMSVPDESLGAAIRMYREDLDATSLEYVIFGHIGNNHVHVNILPRDSAEYDRGKQLYLQWAKEVVRMGGSVAAEHGIGKLKVALLKEMYGPEGIEQMQAIKKLFDPDVRLNRGNLFESL